MTTNCLICGLTHTEYYDIDAKELLKQLFRNSGKVSFYLQGGPVNMIGAEILLKHAMYILEKMTQVEYLNLEHEGNVLDAGDETRISEKSLTNDEITEKLEESTCK